MKCIKCNNADVNVSYHKSNRDCGWKQRNDWDDICEHLHKCCRVCGYSWATHTFDFMQRKYGEIK